MFSFFSVGVSSVASSVAGSSFFSLGAFSFLGLSFFLAGKMSIFKNNHLTFNLNSSKNSPFTVIRILSTSIINPIMPRNMYKPVKKNTSYKKFNMYYSFSVITSVSSVASASSLSLSGIAGSSSSDEIEKQRRKSGVVPYISGLPGKSSLPFSSISFF